MNGAPPDRVARQQRELPEHDGRPRAGAPAAADPRGGRAPARPRGARRGRRRAAPPVGDRPFAGPRPAWEQAGALIVPDAGPHEAVKLRLLNGTHSLLAYVGSLAGARTVAGAWGDRYGRGRGRATSGARTSADAPRGAGHRHRGRPRRARPPRTARGSRTGWSRSPPTARSRSCRRASPSRRASAWPTARRRAGSRSSWPRGRATCASRRAASRCATRPPSRSSGRSRPRDGHREEAGAVLAVLGEEVAGSAPMADLVVRLAGAHRRRRHDGRAQGGRARLT